MSVKSHGLRLPSAFLRSPGLGPAALSSPGALTGTGRVTRAGAQEFQQKSTVRIGINRLSTASTTQWKMAYDWLGKRPCISFRQDVKIIAHVNVVAGKIHDYDGIACCSIYLRFRMVCTGHFVNLEIVCDHWQINNGLDVFRGGQLSNSMRNAHDPCFESLDQQSRGLIIMVLWLPESHIYSS